MAIGYEANQGWGDYAVFGLKVRSQIALPELPAAIAEDRAADVTITFGSVAERLEASEAVEPLMQVAPGAFQLNAPAGRYRLLGGREIVVDPDPGASARDVRLYLLGTMMAALCHQRSLLPLHATAVEAAGDAVAFAGESGTGKSTLAAQFHARGRAVLADDLCAIELADGGRPMVRPGLQRIKMWTASLPLAGLAGAALPRIADDIDKVSLPVGPTDARPRRLTRIYVLRPWESAGVSIERLSGPEAVSAVLQNVHRWPLAVAMGRSAAEFAQVLAVTRGCEVFTLRFRHDPAAPLSAIDRLEEIWNV